MKEIVPAGPSSAKPPSRQGRLAGPAAFKAPSLPVQSRALLKDSFQ
jgi:hypothetical protein